MPNEVNNVEASTKMPAQAELENTQKTKGDYTGYFYRSIEALKVSIDELYAEIIILKQNNNGGN